MAIAKIQLEDGRIARFEVPEGTSPEQVMEFARQNAGQFASQTKPAAGFGEQLVRKTAGTVNEIAQGFTGNLWDEMNAGLDAPVKATIDMFRGRGFDLGRAYDESLERRRKPQQEYREQNPVTSTIANLTGAVGTGVGAAKAFPVAAKNLISGTLPQVMLKSGLLGAGTGALYGFGDGEGAADSGSDALSGAAMGGAIGFAAPAIVAGAGKLTRALLQKGLDQTGGATVAQRKLGDVISDMGQGNLDDGLTQVRQAIRAGGPDTVLADVTGVKGQRLARGAANVAGGGDEVVDRFISQRAAGRGSRLRSAITTTLADGDEFRTTIDGLAQQRSASAAPLYDQAFSIKPVWDNRLDELTKDPLIQQGAKRGIRIQQIEALAEGKPFNPTDFAVVDFNDAGEPVLGKVWNLRTLDAAKRGLDEIIEAARDGVTGKVQWNQYLRAVDKLRGSLVNKLDDLTGGKDGLYAQARAAYAGPSKLMDAANMGKRFISGDAEITAKTLAGMADDQKEAFRVGAARALQDMINSDTQAAVTRLADKKEGLWSKIASVFPDERSFNAFRQQVANEIQKARTERFVSPRAGSHTTPMGQDITALAENANPLLTAAQKFGQGNYMASISGLAGDLARGAARRLSNPDPKMARELSEMLMTSNPTQIDAVLAQIGQRRMANDVLPLLQQPNQRSLALMLTQGGASQR